jgi:hypothetical protein
MGVVVIERGLAVELGIEDHIAGVLDAARVDTDLEMQEAGNARPEALERGFNPLDVVGPLTV